MGWGNSAGQSGRLRYLVEISVGHEPQTVNHKDERENDSPWGMRDANVESNVPYPEMRACYGKPISRVEQIESRD